MLEQTFHSRDALTWDLGEFGVSLASHGPGLATGRHAHARGCLHFVLAGLYVEHGPEGSVIACPGDLVLKAPGFEHWNGFGSSGARTLRIEVDGRLLQMLVERVEARGMHRAPAPIGLCAAMYAMADAMARSGDDRTRQGRVLRRALGDAVESCDDRADAHGVVVDGTARPELRALRELRASFREPADLGRLAGALGVHRSHLTRQFSRRFGCSPRAFLQARRAAWVAERVARDEAGLARLALDAGFSDQSHCTRVFKRWLGSAPIVWVRERRRAEDGRRP